MGKAKSEVIREVTASYLATIDPANPPAPADVQATLLADMQSAFELENAMRAKNAQWRIPQKLELSQIADIILKLYPIKNIAYSGLNADPDYDVLCLLCR